MAESGDEALRILSLNKTIDLVISDMNMPVMDGVQLAKKIKEMQPELPIIFLSSMGNEQSRTEVTFI